MSTRPRRRRSDTSGRKARRWRGPRGLLLLGGAGVLAAAVYVGLADGQGPPAAVLQTTAPVDVYGYEVVTVYPHDSGAFTQGLVYRDGSLYEGTGINGRSSLREVRLDTGEVVRQVPLDEQYFGEGVVDWGDRLLQLTWTSNIGFVYARDTFARVGSFTYEGQGWGLTHDGSRIIMSDGTARLRFLDPDTLDEIGAVDVRDGTRPLERLNELEYVDGLVYANVWQTDRVAMIDVATGRVSAWLDLTGLLDPRERLEAGAVLNGIAYDADGDRLFVTGKLWPKLFEIRLVLRGT